MKQFIPVGPQFLVLKASFMAPATVDDVITANKRYEILNPMDSAIPHHGGIVGSFVGDNGHSYVFAGQLAGERVPVRVDEQIDLHAIQKRRLRYRHMAVKGFKRAFRRFGWDDSIKNPFGFSNRRNPRHKANYYETHSLAEFARLQADSYFGPSGELIADYIYVPEHEINQEYFDEMAREEISNW